MCKSTKQENRTYVTPAMLKFDTSTEDPETEAAGVLAEMEKLAMKMSVIRNRPSAAVKSG